MKNLLAALLLCASTAAQGACMSTRTAMNYVESHGLHPIIVRGPAMTPFVNAWRRGGPDRMQTVNFIAIIRNDAASYAFLGNLSVVCGPLLLTPADVNILMRPA